MHHVGHYYYHAPRLSELKRIYWAHTVRSLASNLTLLFIPIFLYRNDYTLTEILGYFLLFDIIWIIIQYPLLKFANRIGTNRSMGISLILQAIHILMLASLTMFGWPLWVLALLGAIYTSLYWPCFRACFAKSLLHKKVGPAVGTSIALLTLAYGIAPAIGGAIATGFGIGVLYVVATALFIAAAIPLFGGKEIIKNAPFDLKSLSVRKVRRDLMANIGGEIDDDVLSIVWPLFIFLLVPTYIGVGALSSISVIGGILIALYIGKRQELRGTTKYLHRGTLAVGATNLVRLLSQSVGQIAGVNFVNGLFHALVATPYNSRYYTNAEKEPLLPYVFAMMIVSALGGIILFGTLLVLSLFLPIKIVLLMGLLLAVPAGLIMRLIR